MGGKKSPEIGEGRGKHNNTESPTQSVKMSHINTVHYNSTVWSHNEQTWRIQHSLFAAFVSPWSTENWTKSQM